MPHISSTSYARFVLLNGAMSPHPFVTACLRVGGNGNVADARPSPEYTISAEREAVNGRLVWDADHRRNGLASSFFSVAPVKLRLNPAECLLSVGTGDYLCLPVTPYRWIEKIQVGAITGTEAPARTITWDFIEVDFSYTDGRTETQRSNCLPRVATGIPLRRSVQADDSRRRPYPQQFTEILTGSREVVEIKIRGQVTLRANDQATDGMCPLLAEDLQGRIQVFTDGAPARDYRA
jgi:hypothetical protein